MYDFDEAEENTLSAQEISMQYNGQGITLPVFETPHVYHVGTLDRAKRGAVHSVSQEGHCLSVSLVPDAWRHIAKLGGSPTHTLVRSDAVPGRFLDVWTALDDAALREAIQNWGVAEGLVEAKVQFRAYFYSEDDLCYSDKTTRGEAELEHDPDTERVVEEVNLFVATPAMVAILGKQTGSVLDLVAALWVETHFSAALDGVWWDEDLDLYAYSAPRGGIFPATQHRWITQ